MAHASGKAPRIGLFLHPDAGQRQAFVAACAEAFDRLLTADSVASARHALAQNRIALLVLDLGGQEAHRAELAALVRARQGAPVLALAPYNQSALIPELMAQGPLAYLMTPVPPAALREAVAAQLTPAASLAAAQQHLLDREAELNDLLTLQRSLQRALYGAEEAGRMAARACMALCGFPGICHAALLQWQGDGQLRLLAQEGPAELHLEQLLETQGALHALPAGDAFPGLLAARKGEMAMLDAPEKATDAALATALAGRGAGSLLAVPLRGQPGGPVLGALSLIFDRSLHLSREHFNCFGAAAQLISFGMVMAELRRQNDALAGQLGEISPLDGLTGVANRRQGEAVLEGEIRRARRYGLPLAVIAFDLDSFRTINELHGYTTGDRALQALAGAVQHRLRSSDLLARMRGEQFLIVATHTTAVDAFKLAEELRESIAATELPGGDSVTASLGVAQLAPEEGAAALQARLEAAMQRAKRAGRNCVELAMAR